MTSKFTGVILKALQVGNMANLVVKTADGLLRGRKLQSVLGGSFFSFQGIPYAQPPVGDLRFQPPKRVEPWIGEKLALREGTISPQMPFTPGMVENKNCEDCLYLNVYTKEIDEKSAKKPVLVWIHGGAFFFGSGNTDLYGPDFLVLRNIVLVTINYRLGVLGFLSLQNEACPGNNGLRDQVEALHWVQRNIADFGGDPGNVTLFGESAGGASVQLHMMSPLSQGLFHRAITQSASALSGWALARKPVEAAFKLAELLGFKTDSKDKLFEFLKSVPAESIVNEALRVLPKIEPETYYLRAAFLPTVEPAVPGAFLSEPIENLIQKGQLHDVPYIIGLNTLEGLIMGLRQGFPPLRTQEELERLLPIHPNLKRGSPLAYSITKKIKDYYFSNGYSETRCVDAISALYFINDNQDVLNGLAANTERKSPTYFYHYTLECGGSIFKPFGGFSDMNGTCHGDELSLLFYSHYFQPQIKPNSDYAKGIDLLCQFWVDFARTGNPTPKTNEWPVYKEPERAYLDISLPVKKGNNLYAEDIQFWNDIFIEIKSASSAKL